MENKIKNNLFFYATSELSQDAFICYLMSFLLKDAKEDSVLQACAKSLLVKMVPKLAGKNIVLENVERQIDHMDVLLTVISEEEKYKIVVEDKINTSEHSNQLLRYLDIIHKKYPEFLARGVYYKTGFQSDLSVIEEAGYQIITRSEMLDLLAPFKTQTSNQIILDYYEYWSDFEQAAQSFQKKDLSEWDWRCVNAFYDSLKNSSFPEEKQVEMGYDYVANPSGGFDALWIVPYKNQIQICDISCRLYLQIEAAGEGGKYTFPICLKLAPDSESSKESWKKVRDTIVYDEWWNYRLSDYHFKKPSRLGSGGHMTIGVYDAKYEKAEKLKEALSLAIDEYTRIVSDLQSHLCYRKHKYFHLSTFNLDTVINTTRQTGGMHKG